MSDDRSHGRLLPYLFILPAAGLLLLFILGPAVAVVVLALTDWQLGAASLNFVGGDNFRALAQDDTFRQSAWNTTFYVLMVVPGGVLIGLGLALLVEAHPSLRGFYRTVYFLPVTATLIAMAFVWEFILHPSLGLLNRALGALGIGAVNWLSNPDTVLPALALIGIWQMAGFNMILFAAGLRTIPAEYGEAASLDGASAVDRFFMVTWPLLGPVALFVAVINAIRAFQVFDTVAALTRGGPLGASEVILYTSYREAFAFFRTGYASAMIVVFLIVLLAFAWLQLRLGERRVHYA